jgi:hypothetical protein
MIADHGELARQGGISPDRQRGVPLHHGSSINAGATRNSGRQARESPAIVVGMRASGRGRILLVFLIPSLGLRLRQSGTHPKTADRVMRYVSHRTATLTRPQSVTRLACPAKFSLRMMIGWLNPPVSGGAPSSCPSFVRRRASSARRWDSLSPSTRKLLNQACPAARQMVASPPRRRVATATRPVRAAMAFESENVRRRAAAAPAGGPPACRRVCRVRPTRDVRAAPRGLILARAADRRTTTDCRPRFRLDVVTVRSSARH